MPALANSRHERFAQEIASGKGPSEAYRLAGFASTNAKSISVSASRLLAQPSIDVRVAEILLSRENRHAQATAKAVERIALTKEWILGRLVENVDRAMQACAARGKDGEPCGEFKYEGSVANRALELLGKELGMFIDRKEVRNVDEFEQISDVDTLRQRLLERAQELGARDIAAALAGGTRAPGEQLN